MKFWWTFSLSVLAGFSCVPATGDSVDPATQEVVSTPIQALTSPSLLSAVEENSRATLHGNDRHYTNGMTLLYTTGPLSEKSIWNAPTRWLGESSFLFYPQTLETDDRLEWITLGQSIFTPQNHKVSCTQTNLGKVGKQFGNR